MTTSSAVARGSANLKPSVFGNPFKVRYTGRIGTIRRCEEMLSKNGDLLKRLPQLLDCYCRANQACHADIIIKVYKSLFQAAFNREDISTATAPSAEVLSRLANLREVPDSDDGSTADQGAPARGAGWVGTGKTNADWIGVHEARHATARHWYLQAAGLCSCTSISPVPWALQLSRTR